MKGAIRVLFIGGAAGYLAGRVMDQATTWFYTRQSDASKQREGELLPEGAPVASARKLAGLIGAEPTEDRSMGSFLEELNRLGEDGWEAVGITPRTHYDRGGGPGGGDSFTFVVLLKRLRPADDMMPRS